MYLFTKRGSIWKKTETIVHGTHNVSLREFSYFGSALRFSPDGDTLFIGSYSSDNNLGAVYVLTKGRDAWEHHSKIGDNTHGLTGPNRLGFYYYFGASVAISSDGNTLFVGSYSDAIYVFTKDGDSWEHNVKIIDGFNDLSIRSGDGFGSMVSLYTDSDNKLFLLSGAYADDTGGTDRGAVYILDTGFFSTPPPPRSSSSRKKKGTSIGRIKSSRSGSNFEKITSFFSSEEETPEGYVSINLPDAYGSLQLTPFTPAPVSIPEGYVSINLPDAYGPLQSTFSFTPAPVQQTESFAPRHKFTAIPEEEASGTHVYIDLPAAYGSAQINILPQTQEPEYVYIELPSVYGSNDS